MKKDNYFWIYVLIGGIILLLSQSCAPIFSEVQSARMAGKGKFQATPAYSTMHYKGSEGSESMQRNTGLQLVYGVSHKVDFRFRYERVWLPGEGISEGFDVIAFGPKFQLAEDKMAINILVGRALGEGMNETWETQISFLGTVPVVKDKLDFTAAPKLVIPLASEGSLYPAINLNLAISNNLNKWAIIPEYGLLFSPGNVGFYGQFSLGMAVSF